METLSGSKITLSLTVWKQGGTVHLTGTIASPGVIFSNVNIIQILENEFYPFVNTPILAINAAGAIARLTVRTDGYIKLEGSISGSAAGNFYINAVWAAKTE